METKSAPEGIREVQEVRRRKFSVEEYHQMGEAGIFAKGERVELIEGEVVQMNPIGSRHAACVKELTWILSRVLNEEHRLDVQNPVKIDGGLEPQPDLMVVRARDYKDSLPGPEDVLLLIEVSDTTLSYDRSVKLPLYARAGYQRKLDRGPRGRVHRTPQRSFGDRLRAYAAGCPGQESRLRSLSGPGSAHRRRARIKKKAGARWPQPVVANKAGSCAFTP